MNSLAAPGGLLGPGGLYTDPYFDLRAPGAPATNFTAVAFSTGELYGSGSVVVNQFVFPDATAPEPSFLAPVGLLLILGLVRLWRKKLA
jgi:hypothetical protein